MLGVPSVWNIAGAVASAAYGTGFGSLVANTIGRMGWNLGK